MSDIFLQESAVRALSELESLLPSLRSLQAVLEKSPVELREAFYKDLGPDVLLLVERAESVQEHLQEVYYYLSGKERRRLKNLLDDARRTRLDKMVKSAKKLQAPSGKDFIDFGFHTYDSGGKPDSDPREPNDRSIYDVDGPDDRAKISPESPGVVTDWSNFSLSMNTPHIPPTVRR